MTISTAYSNFSTFPPNDLEIFKDLPIDIELKIDEKIEIWLKKGQYLSANDFSSFQSYLKNLSIETRLSLSRLAKKSGIQSQNFQLLLEENFLYLERAAENFFNSCDSYKLNKQEIDKKIEINKNLIEKSDFSLPDFSLEQDHSPWSNFLKKGLQDKEVFETKEKMADYQLTAHLIETISQPFTYVKEKVCNSHPNMKEVCKKTEELSTAIGNLLLTPFAESLEEAKNNYQANLNAESQYHADILDLNPLETKNYQNAACLVQGAALGLVIGAAIGSKVNPLKKELTSNISPSLNFPVLKLSAQLPKHFNEFACNAQIYRFSKSQIGKTKSGFLEASLPYVKTNQEILFVIRRSITHLEIIEKVKQPIHFSSKNLTPQETLQYLIDGLLDFSHSQRYRKVLIAWNPESKASLLDYCREKKLKIQAKGEFSIGKSSPPLEMIEIHLKN